MMKRIIFAIVALTCFVLLFTGWQMYDRYKVKKVYELLEENITITEPERIPVEKIKEVLEQGINSAAGIDLKEDLVSIINQRMQTNLTSDQLTIHNYEAFLDVSFPYKENISYLYRYYLEGYVTKFASTEKYHKTFTTGCYNDNHIKRTVDYDRRMPVSGIRFLLYCMGCALAFIIPGTLALDKNQYRDLETNEYADKQDFDKTKVSIPVILIKFIISGIVILLPVIAITNVHKLIYDPYFISNKVEKILDQHSNISEVEHLSVALIKNAIKDYEEEIKKDPYQRVLFYFMQPEQSLSDDLQKLMDKFLSNESNILHSEVAQVYMESLSISSDAINFYYFWDHVALSKTYYTDGRVDKMLYLTDKNIRYDLYNSDNHFVELNKYIDPKFFNTWSMIVCTWIAAYVCYAYGLYNSWRKKPIRLWNMKQERFVKLYDRNAPVIGGSFNTSGSILLFISLIVFLFQPGSIVTLNLIGLVAGFLNFKILIQMT